MITVSFFKENGRIVKVAASGHSGLADSGSDILCAATSALVQTAYLAIADITKDVSYTRDDKTASFTFTVDGGEKRHDIDVIIRALYVGLKDLESGYPQNLKTEER